MKSTGIVAHLQIAPGKHVPMRVQNSLQAVSELGLDGDWHARKESKRQVLLMDEETLLAFGLNAGRVRENITTRGIELKTLSGGTRMRVGGAVVAITIPCAPCEFIEDIQPGLRAQMDGQRGLLARVIHGGEIRVGDKIEIL